MWIIQSIITLVTSLVVAFISYKLGQRNVRNAQRHASEQEDADLRLYADIVERTKDGEVFKPTIESEEFKRALRLEQKGLLDRLPGDAFRVHGAKVSFSAINLDS